MHRSNRARSITKRFFRLHKPSSYLRLAICKSIPASILQNTRLASLCRTCGLAEKCKFKLAQGWNKHGLLLYQQQQRFRSFMDQSLFLRLCFHKKETMWGTQGERKEIRNFSLEEHWLLSSLSSCFSCQDSAIKAQ
ncbi:unnamed protein product [Musa hybrid cultivar]